MHIQTELPPLSSVSDLVGPERPDVLRRFAPTEHKADLKLMERTVRLETNSRELLGLAQNFFERHQFGDPGQPEFLWRVVCEADSQVQSTAVPLSAFSNSGLHYVNVGQRSFLAVDLATRRATAFLADRFLEGEPRLRHRPPLDILFCMTAASLGLTPLSAGCVGVEQHGVLVFGPPNSGKTTASYLAARSGFEFHADQVVFLDLAEGILRAWGDPFPAVFRPETLEFLPELKESAKHSTYAAHTFYYFDKGDLQPRRARSLTPVCSIFLDRGAPHRQKLAIIPAEEAISQLRASLLFREDVRFDAQIDAALAALVEKPVYRLSYDQNPKTAASVIEGMLR